MNVRESSDNSVLQQAIEEAAKRIAKKHYKACEADNLDDSSLPEKVQQELDELRAWKARAMAKHVAIMELMERLLAADAKDRLALVDKYIDLIQSEMAYMVAAVQKPLPPSGYLAQDYRVSLYYNPSLLSRRAVQDPEFWWLMVGQVVASMCGDSRKLLFEGDDNAFGHVAEYPKTATEITHWQQITNAAISRAVKEYKNV